jgi:hypothetical protein
MGMPPYPDSALPTALFIAIVATLFPPTDGIIEATLARLCVSHQDVYGHRRSHELR